jgi:hypothetical protein
MTHSPCDEDILPDVQSFTAGNKPFIDKSDENGCRFRTADIHAYPTGGHEKVIHLQNPELEGFADLVLPFERLVKPKEAPLLASRGFPKSSDDSATPGQHFPEALVLINVFDPNSEHSH